MERHRTKTSSFLNKILKAQVKKVSVNDLSTKDAIVAVMGPTGSGKSSFIEMATGINGTVGHSLESRTDEISVIKLSFPGVSDLDICFLDTPGFDDTYRSDVEILRLISDWLNNTYDRKIQLTGLLYFHRITDNRMAGTPLKNLRMFEKLCGDKFNNIVLTTTMWDEVAEEDGNRREKELKSTYWKAMMDRGSSVERFLYTRDSAFDVLKPIFEQANKTSACLLQMEMSNLNKETSAARTLYLELDDLVSRQRKILGKVRGELHEEGDLGPDELQLLMQEYEKVSAQLRRVIADLQKVKISSGERLQNFFSREIDWEMLSISTHGKKKSLEESSSGI